MIKHKAMEPLQIYGYMTLGAQHGHKEVVVEEAWLGHCILLTTEAGAGDSWGGPALDCVPRGGQLRLGGPGVAACSGECPHQARQVPALTISAGVGSSLDTAARG